MARLLPENLETSHRRRVVNLRVEQILKRWNELPEPGSRDRSAIAKQYVLRQLGSLSRSRNDQKFRNEIENHRKADWWHKRLAAVDSPLTADV
jgi:hypothetical protein